MKDAPLGIDFELRISDAHCSGGVSPRQECADGWINSRARLAFCDFSAIGPAPLSMTRHSVPRLACVAALLLANSGCRREQIRVYIAPKETPPPAAERAADRPRIAWKLPEGWREVKPTSRVSFASFSIAAAEGEATVDLSQMPDLRGRESLIVNMFRQQVGVEPLGDDEAAKALTPLEAGGGQAQSFEIAGAREGKPIRIITAMLHRPEGSWFFKLAGDDAAASAHKAEFLEFVKTVRFVEGEAAASAGNAAPPAPAAPDFKWSVPEGWQAVAAGAMQAAKFNVPEQNGAKAEVAVSIFPSESGGTLANVNRWRKQLGLEEVDEAALKDFVTPLDATPGAQLVDLVKDQRRMLGAIVPRESGWWFYKMTGDAPAVEAARESFLAFVKSAP